MMGLEQIFTTGVYGFSEDRFFASLVDARVDLFCDIRARRGLRGSKYSFANSRRLQDRLNQLSIPYVHIKECAPSSAVRDAQREHDRRHGIGKRNREQLGDMFKEKYQAECLVELDARDFIQHWVKEAKRPVFFCVEKHPEACHRSLLTNELTAQTGISVEHLLP